MFILGWGYRLNDKGQVFISCYYSWGLEYKVTKATYLFSVYSNELGIQTD